MGVSLEQFIQQIEKSGIVPGDTLRDFVPPKGSAKDSQDLANELIRQKKLTRFQAEEIYRGKGNALKLGNYLLMEKIGAGGMGQVFKAQHLRMKRVVAIKLLPASMTKDKDAIARFEREVEAAAKISHPNIVAAFDADCANGIHFLVMEFVEGSDLALHVKKNGPLSVEKAVESILQAAKGLEIAHKKGIIHRDIKPANLLLGTDGVVKILDMGLARLGDEVEAAAHKDLTTTGVVMGTIDYMSPEQAISTKTADERADIYSLGCTLWYLLKGRSLYEGDSMMARLLAHRDQPIPSLCAGSSEASEALDGVFRKMVAKGTEDRYQNMTQLIAELEQCLPGTGNAQRSQAVIAAPTKNDKKLSRDDLPVTQVLSAESLSLHPSPIALTRKSNPKRHLLVGSSFFASFLLLAGIVISLKTKDGTLVVTVSEADADVQVMNEAGQVELTRKGEKAPITIAVDPGKHRLKVTKDGFEFFTQDFSIEAGATQPITAKLIPLADKPVAKSPSHLEASPDRAAAEWVLSVGGTLRIIQDGNTISIASGGTLPDGPLAVEDIDIRGLRFNPANKELDINKELHRFTGMNSLKDFSISDNPVTDEGFSQLKDLPQIRKIAASGTLLTDASADTLLSMPMLSWLDISKTGITPGILSKLTSLRALNQLQTSWPFSPTAATELLKLPALNSVYVHETWLTEEGVSFLKQKPIRWFGVFFNGELSDERVELLTGFTELEKLFFKYHEPEFDLDISSNGFRTLARLPKLRLIEMVQFPLRDDQATEIAKLNLLESFRAVHYGNSPGSPLTDAGLESLSQLPNLKELDLSRTKITPDGLARFRAAKPNCKLIIDVK